MSTPKPRPPGPWRSMPPRLAYVWLRGLIGRLEPGPTRVVFVSLALIVKCRRHLKPMRPLRGVGDARNLRWPAFRIDGHRVVGDSLLWDTALYQFDWTNPPLLGGVPFGRIAPVKP